MQSYRMLLSPSDFGPEEYVPHYWMDFDNNIINLGQGSTQSGGIGASSGQYLTTLMTTFYYTPTTGSIKLTNNDATVVEYDNIGSTSLLFTGSAGSFQAIGPTSGASSRITINDIISGDTDYSVETDGTAAGDIITHYPDNTAGGTMFLVRVTSTAGKISLSGGEGSCSVDSDQDIVLTNSVDRLNYNWRLVDKYSDNNFTHAVFAYYRAETVASAAPITITTDSVSQIAVEVHTFTTSNHASRNDWEMRDCVPPPVYEELDTGWIKVNQGFTPVSGVNCWLDDQEAGMDELDGVGAIYDPQGSGSRDFTGKAWSQEFNTILPEDAIIFDIEIRVTVKRINSVAFTRNRVGAAVADPWSGNYNTLSPALTTNYITYETNGLFGITRSDITPSTPLGVYFDYRMPSAAMGGVDIDYAEMKVHYRARVDTPVTPTPTATVTPSAVTPTPTATVTPSAVTPTVTPTMSVTPTVTASVTPTITVTPTISVTPSVTPSSVTPTPTPSNLPAGDTGWMPCKTLNDGILTNASAGLANLDGVYASFNADPFQSTLAFVNCDGLNTLLINAGATAIKGVEIRVTGYRTGTGSPVNNFIGPSDGAANSFGSLNDLTDSASTITLGSPTNPMGADIEMLTGTNSGVVMSMWAPFSNPYNWYFDYIEMRVYYE